MMSMFRQLFASLTRPFTRLTQTRKPVAGPYVVGYYASYRTPTPEEKAIDADYVSVGDLVPVAIQVWSDGEEVPDDVNNTYVFGLAYTPQDCLSHVRDYYSDFWPHAQYLGERPPT